ncbi:glycosyltransferase [Halobellus ordinarius]|uniref:glycosyltransferase n=1 Tax=Halobellus ordinarius TaxID=3075120 RepID=UPI002880613A|nr:glycosyltransferase [Halobellus sp. ZY16]
MRRLAIRLLALTGVLAVLTALPYLLYLLLHAVLDPEGVPAEKGTAEPTVSIVVPTYNEAAIIDTKLADIVALDYPMEKVEVILADASTDDTIAVAREFFADCEAPELTVLHDDERRGVAAAVNEAVANATGEVIFRTDADSALDPGVLREAAATLVDPSVGVVTGRQTKVLGDSTVETNYRNLLTIVQAIESRLDSTFIVHGPCVAFRQDDYVPVPTDAIADDTALALAIRRTGKRVVMDPAMRFVESGVSSFRTRRTRKDRRAKGLLQMLVRNRDMLGQYGAYGRLVLPVNWWFMIVSPWLIAAGVALASLAALLVAGPFGLVLPAAVTAYVWLGQRDALGPLGAPYAVLDSQVSLWLASVDLLTSGAGDGTWTVDRDSREAFE